MMLLHHFPALQVMLPFIGALLTIFTLNRQHIARKIAIVSVLAGLIVSIAGLCLINHDSVSYAFGNWQPPIGIEYKLTSLNQSVIIYINFALFFFLNFCNQLTNDTILKFISPSRRSLFYSVLLLTHSGYLGMISTNDFFNLYVFIEISSLGSYVLMAQGNNPKSVVGAFDYLMLGSIGATLILIGIGFLLSITGSLNMGDVAARIHANNSSRIIVAISFFLTGAFLKVAFFPLHFWMVRAYKGAAPVILVYLAGISSIIGVYVIFKFVNLDDIVQRESLMFFIRVTSLFAIVVCAYLAYRAAHLTNIVIYSAASQVGYALFLLTNQATSALLFPFLLVDGFSKMSLFLVIAYKKAHHDSMCNDTIWRIMVVLILVFSSGLPISAMFFIKLNIFETLLAQNSWLDFVIILSGATLSLLYHYEMAKILFWHKNSSTGIVTLAPGKYYGLISVISIQFLLLFSLNRIMIFFA